MEWLGSVASAVTGLAGGGLFGALLGVGSKYLQERQRQEWQEKVWNHEKELLELQSKARASETESELKIVREAGSWQAKRESMKGEQTMILSGQLPPAVIGIRSLWRPTLTLLLILLVLWVWISLIALLRGESNALSFLSPKAVVDLLSYIVYSVVFAASTAALWWFGDRALSPPGTKHK